VALAQSNIPIRLAASIDTKTDPKQVQGKLLRLENAIFTSTGRLKKRNGYQLLSSYFYPDNTNLAGRPGSGLASYNDELISFDPHYMFSYSPAAQERVLKGPVQSLVVTNESVIPGAGYQYAPDSVYHPNGYILTGWWDSSDNGPGASWIIQDATTKDVLVPANVELSSSTPAGVKTLVLGANLVFIFWDGTTKLMARIISPSQPYVTTLVTLTTNFNGTSQVFDATSYNNYIYVTFNSTTASTIGVAVLNEAGSVTTANFSGHAASQAIAIVPNHYENNLYIAYGDGANVRTFTINSANLALVTADNVVGASPNTANVTLVEGAAAGNMLLLATIKGPYGNSSNIIATSFFSGGLPTGFSYPAPSGVSLASKAFKFPSPTVPGSFDYFYWTSYTSKLGLQNCYFLVYWNSIEVVARSMYTGGGLGGGLQPTCVLPEVNIPTAGTAVTAQLKQNLVTTIVPQQNQANPGAPVNPVYTQTGAFLTTVQTKNEVLPYQSVELANVLHVSGGILNMYDGVAPVEHGFLLYPEGFGVVAGGPGTGFLSAGSYQYVLVYEWRDAQGNLYESQASPAVSVTCVDTDSCDFTLVPNYTVGQKQDATIVIYRTTADGLIFYRQTNFNNPNYNDPTTPINGSLPTDTTSDANLVKGQVLYTTGGNMGCDALPACTALTTYKSRIIALPSEDPYQWWFSKQVVQSPQLGVQFSSYFRKTVDAFGGPLTAVGVIDNYIILFSDNTIRYVTGDGPSDNGSLDDFTPAAYVSTDVGCNNPKSVVRVPMGLMFQTAKGFYLLDRSLAVSYIGADVEGFTNAGQNCISAQLLKGTNQVRFGMDSGAVLVYDYFFQTWSNFTGLGHVAATVAGGIYTIQLSDGSLLQETPGVFYDNGAAISVRAVTSWLQLGGINGFQRAYRLMLLGEYISPHSLLVGVSYDFDPSLVQNTIITPTQPDYWGSGTFWGLGASGSPDTWGGSYPIYQWRIDLARQKCTAVQLTIADLQQSGTGESMSLSALTLVAGVKSTIVKVPTTRIAG
jgi:hypothetical protein